MDVIGATQRRSRMIVLGIGTAAGLVFALPVKTGSVACPPAHEGRTNCLLQHAWAPAFVKVAATIFAAWLLSELLFRKLPEALRRYRAGERLVRRPDDLGRDAVLSDSVLSAATWGIVPEPKKAAWKVVKPAPNPVAARAVTIVPSPDEVVVPEPEPVAEVEPPAAPVRFAGVRALTPAERAARSRWAAARHVRVLTDDEARGRRLRRGNDPALVVSCWSDASSARGLPDDVRAGGPVPA